MGRLYADNILSPRWTPEQDAKVVQMCWNEPRLFMESYEWLDNKDQGPMPFRLWFAQEIVYSIIQAIRKSGRVVRLLVGKGRQEGVTSFFQGYIFALCRLRRHTDALITAYRRETSDAVFDMYQFMYDRLPDEIRPKKERRTTKMLKFSNIHSSIKTSLSGEKDPARGLALQLFHGSEFAHWHSPMATLQSILISMSKNPEVSLAAVETTATDMESDFYTFWQNATEASGSDTEDELLRDWTPVCLPWWIHQEYELPLTERDERFLDYAHMSDAERECLQISNQEWVRAFPYLVNYLKTLTFQDWQRKIKWRRSSMYNDFDSDDAKFLAEMCECVDGEALVSTAGGVQELAAEIQTPSTGDSGIVEKWYDRGEREVVEVTTVCGRRLKTTPTHLFRTIDGWVEAQNLQESHTLMLRPPTLSDEVFTFVKRPFPGVSVSIEITEAWALWLGYFLGDGHHNNTGGFSVACNAKDQDVVQDVVAIIEMVFGRKPNLETRRGSVVVTIGCAAMREYMTDLGTMEPSFDEKGGRSGKLVRVRSGYYKRRLRVPSCIMRSPKHIIARFLSALFECDGHRRADDLISFYTKNPEFANDIQVLLLGFGINATVRREAKRGKVVGEEFLGKSVNLGRRNAEVFMREIGFRGKRKGTTNYSSNNFTPIKTKAKTAGRPPIEITMTDRVKSVSSASTARVYDLTTSTKEFAANGIIVHNSPETMFMAQGQTIYHKPSIFWFIRNTKAEGLHGSIRCNDAGNPVFVDEPDGSGECPLTVFHQPVAGEVYGLGADSALASSEVPERNRRHGKDKREKEDNKSDFSTIEVFSQRRIQVCEYRRKLLDPVSFAEVIRLVGLWYGGALANVEAGYGGGNSAGYAVLSRLKVIYPHIARWERWDSANEVKLTESVGWEPSPRAMDYFLAETMRALKHGAGMLVDENGEVGIYDKDWPRMKIYSKDLLNELLSFKLLKDGSMGAAKGKKDDLVRAMGLSLLALRQLGPPPTSGILVPRGPSPQDLSYNRFGKSTSMEGGTGQFPGYLGAGLY